MSLDIGQIVEIPENSALYSTEKKDFLSKKEELLWLSQKPKYTLYDGILLAGHNGVEQFRIGQRKKLGISGKKKPLYVLAIDKKAQRIFVGQGNNHPGLATKVIKINRNENDIFPLENNEEHISVKFILKNETANATLHTYPDIFFIEFEKPIYNIPENETLKLYLNEKLIKSFNFAEE
ncbi:MAG: hypothetical protein Q4G16_07240, partial [Cruoricaptor ignavus]|nr:hypothetical protein [Cruoricaptor ignavus]